MSRPDGDGAGQVREGPRKPSLNTTATNNHREAPLYQARVSRDSDDVSPRSQGGFSLDDKNTEEIKKKIEEAKRNASASLDADSSLRTSEPPRPPVSSATVASQATESTLNSVSPELLTELRKIIRDEFEQLNKGHGKEEATVKITQPPVVRSRPTSPIRPFCANPGGDVPSARDAEDGKNKSTAGASTPTKGQPRVSPRHSSVRFSEETKPAVTPRVEEARKAAPPESVELTAVDKKWGVLFEPNGTPTKRMEHVVRGLANYVVEEFLPQRSIVITPEKMAAFYSHHRLDKERFPLAVLFRSKVKGFHDALATLYEDLGCQYFLAPADHRSRPAVPSLTPDGFKHWLITMIQAYPDEEVRRLDKVVSALPIEADSLLDGKAERLPKQISRYLFPKEPLRKSRRLVDDVMADFQEDIEGSSASSSKVSSSGGNASKPSPIVVTATSDKRSSAATSNGPSSRYVPENMVKEVRIEEPSGGGGHERDRRTSTVGGSSSSRDARPDDMSRRNSVPPLPAPTNKLSRSGSTAEGSRSAQSSRESHGASGSGASSKVTSSSSSRRHRSPQRNAYSQSVPSGLDGDDDRFRSSNISAAIVNAAANVLGLSSGPHSSQKPSNSSGDLHGSSEQHRDKRASFAEATPRAPVSTYGLRDRADVESRSSKRRSMFMPDTKGATWDDYLKSAAPRSAVPSLSRRDGGYGSAG